MGPKRKVGDAALNMVSQIPLPPSAYSEEGQRGATPAAEKPKQAPRKSFSRRQVAYLKKMHTAGTIAFGAVMALGCFAGLLLFVHPSVSALENRQLTEFPEFSVGAFLDGSYLEQVALWYSDTYPFRDALVGANLDLHRAFGISPETQLIGGNRQSDQLPDTGEGEPLETEAEPEGPKREPRDHDISEPEVRQRAANIENQISDGIYVNGNAAYTLYYFDKGATKAYAQVINDAAKMLEGKADVYSIVLPTNGGVMLDDSVLASLGVPNQDQAIDYFYSCMDDAIITVPTFDTLYAHRDEYLYFRTDFHWTQLAAYYVYESFCQQKGIEPAPYLQWKQLSFGPYRGEYDQLVSNSSQLLADEVRVRVPAGAKTVQYWDDDMTLGEPSKASVVEDLTNAPPNSNFYGCFIGGNRALTYIENPTVTDGSSCLVIKDSFGNPLVSTMVDSYQYIWCVDFRFTHQKMMDLVEEHNIQDVIFENVLMFAGTYDCSDLLASIVYPNGYSME
ncbi:DHHW family protein [Parvibacter caecicola]|uniref:DHHW family protein n=1 Tax=Parvibacter caecicola TaxID=747645 RepID=UPI00273220AC|nr:DHHW family protein [Parvibacter caecicola]